MKRTSGTGPFILRDVFVITFFVFFLVIHLGYYYSFNEFEYDIFFLKVNMKHPPLSKCREGAPGTGGDHSPVAVTAKRLSFLVGDSLLYTIYCHFALILEVGLPKYVLINA